MGIVTFAAGLLLPWLLGIAVLAAMRDTRRSLDAPGEIAWIVGAGYLAGAFLLTLWMRVLSLAGIPFGAAVIGLPLALATVALAYVASRRHGADRDQGRVLERDACARHAAGRRPTQRDSRGGCSSPGSAIRYALLALEVSWQPLYPWDAWIQWATKARVWYERGCDRSVRA